MYSVEQRIAIRNFFDGDDSLAELFVLLSEKSIGDKEYVIQCDSILGVKVPGQYLRFYIKNEDGNFYIKFKCEPVRTYTLFQWNHLSHFESVIEENNAFFGDKDTEKPKGESKTKDPEQPYPPKDDSNPIIKEPVYEQFNVKRFSANYVNTDCNFEIYNLPKGRIETEEYSIFCVLQNIIQRGTVTKMSAFLSERFRDTYDKTDVFHFFSKDTPDWKGAIRGYEPDLKYPAASFYYNVVPKMFGECFQQMLIPEVLITDIIRTEGKAFANQAVDFYLPEMKLVIEIDGSQHSARRQSALDDRRDALLRKNGIEIFRIQAKDIHNQSAYEHIEEYVSHYEEIMRIYEECFSDCMKFDKIAGKFKPALAIRLQIALLELLKSGAMSLDSDINLAIRSAEEQSYVNDAIEDLFIWLENIYQMTGRALKRPTVNIRRINSFSRVPKKFIKIDNSLCTKITNPRLLHEDVIYIATCWNQVEDYYEVQTAPKLKYAFGDGYVSDDELHDEYGGRNERRLALLYMLKNIIGFDEFRQGQERILINALEGRDTIGVLPTGSGKSLCYQLAALLQPGISFCICPIKALMIDQDTNLKAMGIDRTQYIMSSQGADERKDILYNFANRKYQLTFIAPERFQSEEFRGKIQEISKDDTCYFSYAVIDEVHCMSDWGHDFRPSYLNLVNTIKRYCGDIVLFGLTATASLNVLKNLEIEFCMTDRRNIISVPEFTRKELEFDIDLCEVSQKDNVLSAKLYEWKETDSKYFIPHGIATKSGIVFTPHASYKSRYGCFRLAAVLEKNIPADVRAYAGEEPKSWNSKDGKSFEDYKREVQDGFKDNKFPLLCATKAFGMGIDKPNVRYTMHYGIPSSLEALYQEAGRAGRDRKRAYCSIIYSPEGEEEKELLLSAMEASSVEKFKNSVNAVERKKQCDIYSQAYFLSNGMLSDSQEIELIEMILGKYRPAGIETFNYKSSANKELQKVIYHFAIVGIVDDWTIDWKNGELTAYFSDKNGDEIFKTLENHIHKYDADYDVLALHKKIKAEYMAKPFKVQVIMTFWEWYKENILYSRKMALRNVVEACDEFAAQKKTDSKKAAAAFKERMESYFRLDDVADRLGEIADFPREYAKWFKVLNLEVIERKHVRGILATLSRFLESYQYNVGLNFISGILNLLNHNFETENGRHRLVHAVTAINEFDEQTKLNILKESCKIVGELGDEQQKQEMAAFFINNYDLESAPTEIYKIMQDDYSLDITFKMNLSALKKILMEE